jgi:hypothetical protein
VRIENFIGSASGNVRVHDSIISISEGLMATLVAILKTKFDSIDKENQNQKESTYQHHRRMSRNLIGVN